MLLTLSNTTALMPLLAGVGAFVLLLLIVVVVMYNKLVNIRQLCMESFADIDTELQRRHDLIPNLVSIVKGYAKHESELFERITQARAAAVASLSRVSGRDVSAQRELNASERELSGLMGQIMVISESYPDLKADENFRQLMTEVRNTEDRIQAARRFYNANVRELNNRCQQFPSTIVAKLFSFEQRDYFEVENPVAKAPVNISMS